MLNIDKNETFSEVCLNQKTKFAFYCRLSRKEDDDYNRKEEKTITDYRLQRILNTI